MTRLKFYRHAGDQLVKAYAKSYQLADSYLAVQIARQEITEGTWEVISVSRNGKLVAYFTKDHGELYIEKEAA